MKTPTDYTELEQQYGLPAGIMSAVETQESGGNDKALSDKGARGRFQIMPETAHELGIDPSDPAQAAAGAAHYLSKQLQRFGTPELALAAYNAGPGNVHKYGGIPPFKETQNYVKTIMGKLGDRPLADSNGQDTLAGGAKSDAMDYDSMSDAELLKEAAKYQPAAPDYDKMSDAELLQEAAKYQPAPPPEEKPTALGEAAGMAELGARRLADLPMGAAQAALESPKALQVASSLPGIGPIASMLQAIPQGTKKDVVQSIGTVKGDTDALEARLNKLYPQSEIGKALPVVGPMLSAVDALGGSSGAVTHAAPGLIEQGLQTGVTGPLFEELQALKGIPLGNYVKNIGAGAGAGGGMAYLMPRSEGTADARESGREHDAAINALIGGGLTATVPALAAAGSFLKDRFNPSTQASNVMKRMLGPQTTNEVIGNIDRNAADAAQIPGFQPTTAMLAKSPGLAQLERGFARLGTEGDAGSAIALRDKANKDVSGDLISSLNPKAPESTQALKALAADLSGQARGNIQGKVQTSTDLSKQAEAFKQTTNEKVTSQLPNTTRADESAKLDEKVAAQFKNDRAAKNELFSADYLDPDNQVQVGSAAIRNPMNDELASYESEAARKAATPAIAEEIQTLPKTISLRQAMEYRPLLSDEIAEARKNNNGALVKTLSAMKKGVESYIPGLAESPVEEYAAAGARAKDAVDFYKNTYAPKWKEGVGAQYARAQSIYKPIPAETVGSKFIRPGDVGASTIRSLNKIAKSDPSIQPIIDNYILSDMQQTPGMMGDDGMVNPVKLKNWMAKNAETLKGNPALKQKVDAMANSLSAAYQKSDEFSEKLLARQQTFKEQEKALNNSALGDLLGKENVTKTISSALDSDAPMKQMRTYVNIAKQDKTGRAMLGLKQATYERISEELALGQLEFGDDVALRASLNKLNKYLTPQRVAALKLVVGEDGVRNINLSRDGLRLLNEPHLWQTVPGSQTTPNALSHQMFANAAKNPLLRGALRIVLGPGASTVVKASSMVGNTKEMLKGTTGALLQKAIMEPEFAKTLLRYQSDRPVTDTIRKAMLSGIPQGAIGTQNTSQEEEK